MFTITFCPNYSWTFWCCLHYDITSFGYWLITRTTPSIPPKISTWIQFAIKHSKCHSMLKKKNERIEKICFHGCLETCFKVILNRFMRFNFHIANLAWKKLSFWGRDSWNTLVLEWLLNNGLVLSSFFYSPCCHLQQNSDFVSPLPKNLVSSTQLDDNSLSATHFLVFG